MSSTRLPGKNMGFDNAHNLDWKTPVDTAAMWHGLSKSTLVGRWPSGAAHNQPCATETCSRFFKVGSGQSNFERRASERIAIGTQTIFKHRITLFWKCDDDSS